MPERKNQHYVPKYYLRAWADSEKLRVLPLSAGKTFPDTTSSVCSRNYFYGNPPVVETELAKLDGHHARPFNRLRDGTDLTELSIKNLQLLLSFITTQRTRSKATKEDINQGSDFLQDGVEDDLENGRYEDFLNWTSDLNEDGRKKTMVDAHLLGIHHYLIAQGIFGYHGIKDLQCVMLCNATDREFIISDAPIVLDNPRYKQQLGLIPVGIGNRGIQIFCPVNQHRILLLYDPVVYRVDSNSKKQVIVKSRDVVDQLNLLQFHNAESIVMYNDSSDDCILDLYERIDEVRQRQKISRNTETESGEEFEFDEAPAYPVPRQSPELPGVSTVNGIQYIKRRPTSQVETGRQLVRKVFDEVNWGSDLVVIYCIRLLEDLLGL